MSGVNKAILVGHLGRDPETRRTKSGAPVVSFSLATSQSWRDKATGERKDRTQWHTIVVGFLQYACIERQPTQVAVDDLELFRFFHLFFLLTGHESTVGVCREC